MYVNRFLKVPSKPNHSSHALSCTHDTGVSNSPQAACNSGVYPLAISLNHLCRDTGFSVPVLLLGTSTAHWQANSRGSQNSTTPALLASCSVCFHFLLTLGQTGYYLALQEQMPDTSCILSRTHPMLSAGLQGDPET